MPTFRIEVQAHVYFNVQADDIGLARQAATDQLDNLNEGCSVNLEGDAMVYANTDAETVIVDTTDDTA